MDSKEKRDVIRLVFMGTPDFAVPALSALASDARFVVAGAVTQPDRPAGRGQRVAASPVKLATQQRAIPVFQPETLREPDALKRLLDWKPDLIVVVAFGQILRQPVLDLAPLGCVNGHASLLPRWRGAAPIQYAIRAGDPRSGVTIMKMDAGLDTGPILAQQGIPIAPDETGASLHDKLAALTADLLPDTLDGYVNGKIQARPQPDEGVTLAKTLKKEEGRIDWTGPAAEIDRQVRAFTPWPGTFTYLGGEYFKIHRGGLLAGQDLAKQPGKLVDAGGELAVQTGDGLYRLDELQLAGKQRMAASAFLAGHRDALGKILG